LLNSVENPSTPNPANGGGLAAKTDPNKMDPIPAKTDPIKIDPVKKDPVIDPVKTDPVEPTRTTSRKIEPPVKLKLPGIVLNPWESLKPGVWYRLKTEKAGKESYADIVLKAKDADSYTLATPGGDVKTQVAPYWVKGEEALTIEDQRRLCE